MALTVGETQSGANSLDPSWRSEGEGPGESAVHLVVDHGQRDRDSIEPDRVWRIAKSIFDIEVGLILLFCTCLIGMAIALLILVTEGRPIFFRQERIGLNGRPFRIFKFRTMKKDAEECLLHDPDLYARYVANNFKFAEDDDPRVTRIGRFLRRTSLDELPQILNVLKRDMSIVGPRPVVAEELAHYEPFVRELVSIRPGLTGYWQANGRSTVNYPHRAIMELDYVRTGDGVTDFEILLKTIGAVLSSRGAW